MPATFQTDGAIQSFQGGNDIGGATTGIGFGGNYSGQPVPGNFTNQAADLPSSAIGEGATANSAANLGQLVTNITLTAGSGYTNGTYLLNSDASGGQPAGAAQIELTVSGGALTAFRIMRPGSGFTSAPTFTLANAINVATGAGIGGGTGGAAVATVALTSRMYARGATYGTAKGMRLQTAGAVIANGATGTGLNTYINRSGRALAVGDQVGSIAP